MKKVLAILLTLVMALSLSVTAFATGIDDDLGKLAEELENLESGNEEATVPVITSVDTNNYYEQDLTVGYTYTAAENSAEKVFCVTVEFSLPDDMALTYTGKQNVYTWDHTVGKYVLDETNSADGEGTLTDGGAFTITVTNKSNVPVEFDVAYTANTDAVFASGVTDWANNADVTLATVAAGHEIGTDGISITDVTTATTANTSFASADCTGKLSVTGINEGKEPGESGTDKLGTFTVTITEAAGEAEAEAILANVLLAKYADTMTRNNPWHATSDSDLNTTTAFIESGKLYSYSNNMLTLDITEEINALGSDNHYNYETSLGDYQVIYTFITNDSGDLIGIDLQLIGYNSTYVKYRPEV